MKSGQAGGGLLSALMAFEEFFRRHDEISWVEAISEMRGRFESGDESAASEIIDRWFAGHGSLGDLFMSVSPEEAEEFRRLKRAVFSAAKELTES